MVWNKNVSLLGKALLALFIGMAIASCAGTGSSAQNDQNNKQPVAQKKWNKNGVLVQEWVFPKYAKEYWDNGKPKGVMTGFLYKDDQGFIKVDSGHTETYFENGKIHQQNDWKDKTPIAGKVWNENGVLIKEFVSSKYYKEYWDNGEIKAIMTGILYRDDQGIFNLDSGLSEGYFENGKIHQQNDWKNKQGIASKQWNENGVLVKEWSIPNYYKEYWDNGKPKIVMTGLIFKDNQGSFYLDSGHLEIYFENGKIHQQKDWKDKMPVAGKIWNESGVLTIDMLFPKHVKEYWDNGKSKSATSGILYRNNQGVLSVDSGHSETCFENGKIKQQIDWKEKQIIAQKEWNENGVLIKEIDFPKYAKEYWDNGKPKYIATGILYRDEQGNLSVDSGNDEKYFENGKMELQSVSKDKQIVTQKGWNENGVLIKEIDFPKYAKEYWDNGKPKYIATGILYRDNQGNLSMDSGREEWYYENGKIKERNDKKDKRIVAFKAWNEKGKLIAELDFPKYRKEYWNNGKPKSVTTGILCRNDHGGLSLDSGRMETFFENGKIKEQIDLKDKQIVAYKGWYENGTIEKDEDASKGFRKVYYQNGKIFEEILGKFHYEDGRIILENGSQKQWDENGNLGYELVFPKYKKLYHENGTLWTESEGTLYYNKHNVILVKDGFEKEYYENGQMKNHRNYKEKKEISGKSWHENGNLRREFVFPKYEKYYFENGAPSIEKVGTLYYADDDGIFIRLQDGFRKDYYKNGQMKSLTNYKETKLISEKNWYENGILKYEFDNGSQKKWRENGNLEYEIGFPKFAKNYSDNGNISIEMEGTLYYDEQDNIQIQDGARKEYHDNGKLALHKIYKGKKLVSKTVWSESGTITISVELPNRYREFYDDGKIKVEATGTIVEENESFRIKDGTYKEYSPDGAVTFSTNYKDFQVAPEKN